MFGLIYSIKTGRIRSIFKADSESQLDQYSKQIEQSGQALVKMDDKEYADLDTLQEKLNAITKLAPENDRYALVDSKGEVVGAVIADPECGDALPDVELVASKEAQSGWLYDKDAKAFTDPSLEAVPIDDGANLSNKRN